MTQVLSQRVRQRARYRFYETETVDRNCSEASLKTRGEIEAAVSERINRLRQEQMGRGPDQIQAHLIDDLLVVRLRGVLTTAEKQLVNSASVENGRTLVKQMRSQLIEAVRPVIEAMIQQTTGVKVVSLHHDISTVTGEEVLLFALAESPDCRQPKKRNDRAVDRGVSRR